jgi:hypothetical protein
MSQVMVRHHSVNSIWAKTHLAHRGIEWHDTRIVNPRGASKHTFNTTAGGSGNENTQEFFCFPTTLPQQNNYGKVNLATWEETLAGFEALTGPPFRGWEFVRDQS